MTSTPAAANQASPPHAATTGSNPASPPSKRDLKSWWKGFKLPSKHHEPQGTDDSSRNDSLSEKQSQGIFGVPLRSSITYANVAISLIDENGQSYIYGYVPIVVAKCGVFLKEKATGIEGIFRLSGSEKRIKELKTIFDSPDKYGKGLVWDGFTVHDAANVFRRYLNDLPEPVVPLDLYEKFREPLRGATKQAVGDAEGPQFVENFDEKGAIAKYQNLITELPPLNRQLLLYILDLLAVFAAKADENRMNSQNLAAIFQPGMLSHPNHAMAPEEYRLNQCVIIFLIENQDHFLIGMQGTAADEQTKQEVEAGSGIVTPSAKRSSGLNRSASDASAGADSVRREGKVRRNRSISSRHSRNDGNTTPNSPSLTATPSNLGRSNTVPSKKSPALAGNKFKKHDNGPHSPSHLEPLTQVTPAGESAQSEQTKPAPVVAAAAGLSAQQGSTAGRSQERLLEVPHEVATPSKERNLPSLFQRSPTDSGEKRQPNKLKKKRIPGSLNPSAQSSNASLSQSHSNAASPGAEKSNPMEHLQPVPLALEEPGSSQRQPSSTLAQQHSDVSSEPTPRASQTPSNTLHPDPSTGAKKSPPPSIHSSFNEGSDMDHVADEQSTTQGEQHADGKKRRWRMSKAKKDDSISASSPPRSTPHAAALGTNDHAGGSNISIGSGPSKPRKSFTGESSDAGLPAVESQTSHEAGKDKDDSKGPIGWIRNKVREAKETAEQRRNKSPPPADRPASGLVSRSKGGDSKPEPGSKEEEKEKNEIETIKEETQEKQPEVQPQPQAETKEPVPTKEPPQTKEPAQTKEEAPAATSEAQPPATEPASKATEAAVETK